MSQGGDGVPVSGASAFETTNFEDVCFGPKNQGLDRKTVELRAYEALQNVHFPEDLYYQPLFDLSE